MNLKKFTRITFILGLSILCASLFLPVIILLSNNNNSPISFIGTFSKFELFFNLLSFAYRGYALLGIILGATLLIISALCKFCKNAIANYMNVKTTLCALIFSFAGGLTVNSFYGLYWCNLLNSPFGSTKHIIPAFYYFCIISACISILLLLTTVVFYIRLKKQFFTKKGLFMDIGFSLLCFPFFFLSLSYLLGSLTL